MVRRQSQIIKSAERPVLPQRSRSSGQIAALVSGYDPDDEAASSAGGGGSSGGRGQEAVGSATASTAARAAQGLSGGAEPLSSPRSPRSPPAKLTKLPTSPTKPPPATPSANAGRFSRANRDKGRSAAKRFIDVFTGASSATNSSRGGIASAPTSPAKSRAAGLTLLPPPPSAPPLSPNPATLGQHYHSIPSSPDLGQQDEEAQMAIAPGKAGHRISLFDALGAVPVPPVTPTTPTASATLKVPTAEAVPFPSVATLTKEEHVRMVSAAEEERARRAYLRKQAWFKVPPGQALRDRDHKLPMDEAPYWMGYGLATGDADAILMEDEILTFDEGSPTGARFENGAHPRRVLDLGCGVWATWILRALQCWRETEFVGLDLMPVLLTPSMLNKADAARVSFVQHNFLHSLPFPENSFDIVRLSHIGGGVPEHQWDTLITAALALLTPAGRLEILDIELESLVLTQETNAHANPPPVLRLFRDATRGFADRRFLDLGHFAHIRAALAVNAGKVETGGKREVGYPVRQRKRREPRDDWEILLPHVAADFTLARKEFITREYLASLEEEPTKPRLHPPASAKEVAHALDSVMGILKAEPLAPLLEQRWGWECAFDLQSARMLDSNLLDLRAQQIDLDVQRVRWRGQNGSTYSETSSQRSAEQAAASLEEEEELILARGVLAFNLREAQSERRSVGMRLRGCGGRGWEVGEDGESEDEGVAVSGAMGCQGWVASKPVG